MAKGKCVNIGKPCSKALKKEIIEADKANFVCPECGGKLVACDGPVTDPDSLKKGGTTFTASNGTNVNTDKEKKKLMYIVGAATVVALAGGTTYFLTSPGMNSDVPVTGLEIADYDPMIWVGTTDTLSVTPTPADAKATYVWSSSNESVATVKEGIVKVVGEGETTITVKVQGKEDISASAKFYAENYAETDEQSGEEKENKEGKTNLPSGKIDLGFATYEGDTKNGKPEGNGTMTFKTRHIIPGAKGDVEAQPGEYVTGTWRNGEVNVVTLYQKNGNKPVIMHR